MLVELNDVLVVERMCIQHVSMPARLAIQRKRPYLQVLRPSDTCAAGPTSQGRRLWCQQGQKRNPGNQPKRSIRRLPRIHADTCRASSAARLPKVRCAIHADTSPSRYRMRRFPTRINGGPSPVIRHRWAVRAGMLKLEKRSRSVRNRSAIT
jgi:hypothetical protein